VRVYSTPPLQRNQYLIYIKESEAPELLSISSISCRTLSSPGYYFRVCNTHVTASYRASAVMSESDCHRRSKFNIENGPQSYSSCGNPAPAVSVS
jgi:hypothetical protein